MIMKDKKKIYNCIHVIQLIELIIILVVLILMFFIQKDQTNNKIQAVYQSFELREIKSLVDNTERVDYVDSNGNVTYASDKHYATIIKTTNDAENEIIEQYYDVKGEPAIQPDGNYALKRLYNEKGQNIETTYLDEKLNPCKNRWNYVTIKRTFNSDGQKEKETFYDEKGNRVKHLTNGYGRYFEYDKETGNSSITYLGIDDKPTKIEAGYSKVERSLWKTGKVKTELYYDVNNEPVCLSLGQHGEYKEYDEEGRICLITYLDMSGKPMITNKGYATVKKTFLRGDIIETEKYYDQNGNPIQLSRGQSGVKISGSQLIYLDAEGKEVLELSSFLRNHPWCIVIIAGLIILLSSFINRKMNIWLLVAYIAFMIYITLLYRDNNEADINLEVFWSYKQFFTSDLLRVAILNNIWLFIPFGYALYRVFQKPKYLVIIIVASVSIEALQFFLKTGLCETDDIISNVFGGLVGFGLGYNIKALCANYRKG